MANVQPPEGLLDAVTKIVSEKWGPCSDYICEADRSGDGAECTATRGTVADVLAALFDACEVRDGDDPYSAGFFAGYSRGSEDRINEIHKAGRLLPHGEEVSTQYGVRWHATPGYGDEWDDWGFSDEAHAREEMASSPTPSTLLRHRTVTLPVEPVVSDTSEAPDG